MDVIVVGAGIAGLSAAHALVRGGASVTVLAPGPGHSARGAGIVSAQFREPDLVALALRSQAILRRLVEVHACGLAQLALSDAAASTLEGVSAACEGLPAPLERRLAPGYRRRIVRAIFATDDFWLDAERTLSALGQGARRIQGRALSIAPHRVDHSAGTLEADVVVVARGPGGALPRLAAPRRTLRRALLAHSEFPLETMFQVVDSHVYGRPDSAGSLFGDGDRAFRGRDPAAPVRPDRAFLRRMCGELSEMFGAHVGCAPAGGGVIDESEDDRPFVERQQGVIVMGGLGGDGFALAPALGERIARSLAEGTDDFGLGPEEAASLAGALAMPAPDEPC